MLLTIGSSQVANGIFFDHKKTHTITLPNTQKELVFLEKNFNKHPFFFLENNKHYLEIPFILLASKKLGITSILHISDIQIISDLIPQDSLLLIEDYFLFGDQSITTFSNHELKLPLSSPQQKNLLLLEIANYLKTKRNINFYEKIITASMHQMRLLSTVEKKFLQQINCQVISFQSLSYPSLCNQIGLGYVNLAFQHSENKNIGLQQSHQSSLNQLLEHLSLMHLPFIPSLDFSLMGDKPTSKFVQDFIEIMGND